MRLAAVLLLILNLALAVWFTVVAPQPPVPQRPLPGGDLILLDETGEPPQSP